MSTPLLFTPLALRSVQLKNRIMMSPMCQGSARDGFVTDWHRLHYPTRAVGGVGLVMVEATAVEVRGMIGPGDVGIWSDEHIVGLQTLTTAIKQHGAVAGIQIAHAGRKAESNSSYIFTPVAPSPLAFSEHHQTPAELSETDLDEVRNAFQAAAKRALEAGFQILELHMAHGYLLHSFLSPISNVRTDRYGGSLENRMRFPLEVTRAIREVWPLELPLFIRVSATDWLEGAWSLEDTIKFAKELQANDVDLIDCSSGGIKPGVQIPVALGYQVQLAEGVKHGADIKTAAVGLITEAHQAETILQQKQADVVVLGRALLAHPYWVYGAAQSLGVTEGFYPVQYERGVKR
jgi:2,4-dienoyl-CoA reductase-like NADH-dependent reductase (Old Yellow Enzyme family)